MILVDLVGDPPFPTLIGTLLVPLVSPGYLLPYLVLSNSDGQMIIGALVLVGIILFQMGDLKELAKTTYRKAKRVYMRGRPPKETELPVFYPEGTDFRVVPSALQRALAAGDSKAPVSAREVLGYATVEGARANGLEHKVGTLTPGKQADIIMLRTDRLNVTPMNDPVTAVVVGMDTSNVDTVIIGGRVMKRGGRLEHVDWSSVRRMAKRSPATT